MYLKWPNLKYSDKVSYYLQSAALSLYIAPEESLWITIIYIYVA